MKNIGRRIQWTAVKTAAAITFCVAFPHAAASQDSPAPQPSACSHAERPEGCPPLLPSENFAPAAGAPGPAVLPGMRVVRQIGPVVFTISLDDTLARLDAAVRVQDASVSGLVMTAQNPTAIFGLTNGDTTVRGSLGTFFCAPPVRSHLLADVTLERRNTSAAVETTYFRGNLVEWDSPASSVIARYTIPLLPDLEARVDLVDSHRQNHINTLTAQISFLYGTQLVDTYALTSTISPVTLRTTAVGAVRIEEGGVLTFRPATAQQRGQIRLKASLRSGESGNTDYDGTLADWPWIEGRADSCRGP